MTIVDDLPVEIFVPIFLEVVRSKTDRTDVIERYRKTCRLTSVSRRWKLVIGGGARFWAVLYRTFPAELVLQILARPHPLTLIMSFSPLEDLETARNSFLYPINHSQRWRSLVYRGPLDVIRLTSERGTYPLLETVDIWITSLPNSQRHPTLFNASAPRLQKVTLRSGAPLAIGFDDPLLSNLTYIELIYVDLPVPTLRQVTHMLSRSPRLVVLKLCLYPSLMVADQSVPPSHPTIICPELSVWSLQLSKFGYLLSHLQWPSCRSLWLVDEGWFKPSLEADWYICDPVMTRVNVYIDRVLPSVDEVQVVLDNHLLGFYLRRDQQVLFALRDFNCIVTPVIMQWIVDRIKANQSEARTTFAMNSYNEENTGVLDVAGQLPNVVKVQFTGSTAEAALVYASNNSSKWPFPNMAHFRVRGGSVLTIRQWQRYLIERFSDPSEYVESVEFDLERGQTLPSGFFESLNGLNGVGQCGMWSRRSDPWIVLLDNSP